MDIDPDNSFINVLNQIADELGDPSVGQLSFRDQCAIAAMQGSIASDVDCKYKPPAHVAFAFDIADAMESERQKRDSK